MKVHLLTEWWIWPGTFNILFLPNLLSSDLLFIKAGCLESLTLIFLFFFKFPFPLCWLIPLLFAFVFLDTYFYYPGSCCFVFTPEISCHLLINTRQISAFLSCAVNHPVFLISLKYKYDNHIGRCGASSSLITKFCSVALL